MLSAVGAAALLFFALRMAMASKSSSRDMQAIWIASAVSIVGAGAYGHWSALENALPTTFFATLAADGSRHEIPYENMQETRIARDNNGDFMFLGSFTDGPRRQDVTQRVITAWFAAAITAALCALLSSWRHTDKWSGPESKNSEKTDTGDRNT